MSGPCLVLYDTNGYVIFWQVAILSLFGSKYRVLVMAWEDEELFVGKTGVEHVDIDEQSGTDWIADLLTKAMPDPIY